MPAWVKKRDKLPCYGVERGNIAPLPGIATQASVREILGGGLAAVLSCDHMIQLMWRIRIVLMQQTVLTSVSCTLRDESPDIFGDITAQDVYASARAPLQGSECVRAAGNLRVPTAPRWKWFLLCFCQPAAPPAVWLSVMGGTPLMRLV